VPTILIHTVKAGDTLSEIAAFYGVSVARIAEANALGDVHFLSIGQELVIPLADFGPTQPGLRLTPTPRVSSRLCSGLDVYAAADAGQHLEEFACVEFRAATTEVVGEDILLVSPQDAGAVFVVAIDREWQDCWAEGPEARFDDRLVRVRGTIEENLGVPQITLGDCSHIELMPSYGP